MASVLFKIFLIFLLQNNFVEFSGEIKLSGKTTKTFRKFQLLHYHILFLII